MHRRVEVHVVVGGQFGSESKGAVTAALVRDRLVHRPVLVRVAGPNAGHTAIDAKGVRFALRQIPVACIWDPASPVVIGAGSEIDLDVLWEEIELLESHGHSIVDRLYVDSQATILTEEHHEAESKNDGLKSTGSTHKGIGAARADRIMRQAETWGCTGEGGLPGHDTAALIEGWMAIEGRDVVVEGTQGYGLGLHTKYYPHTTSSDCRAIDFLAMAGISPWHPAIETVVPWVVIRPNAIRIAGNSGPLKGETSWGELGLKTEYTTVTKLPRRVGAPDWGLVRDAIRANGRAVNVALGFGDYLVPMCAGMDSREWKVSAEDAVIREELERVVEEIEVHIGALVRYVGTGPETNLWRD